MSNYDYEEELKREQLRKDLEKYKKMEREKEVKESLEVIGNSLLSGLASVTSMSAQALENAVKTAKEKNKLSNTSEADKIKARLALKRKQEVLKKHQKVEKKLKKKRNEVKDITGLVAFLISMVGLGQGFFTSLLIAFVASFVVGKLYNPKEKKVSLNVGEIKETSEYDKIMKKANKQLDEIYDCIDHADDIEIRDLATKLYDRGIQIIDYLQGHPEMLSKSSRFLSYYLDTASNICKKYANICDKNIVNADTIKATEDAKRAMILLEKAFDNEFLKLMEDDIIDIETDVKVLENSMKWDNYN